MIISLNRQIYYWVSKAIFKECKIVCNKGSVIIGAQLNYEISLIYSLIW